MKENKEKYLIQDVGGIVLYYPYIVRPEQLEEARKKYGDEYVVYPGNGYINLEPKNKENDCK